MLCISLVTLAGCGAAPSSSEPSSSKSATGEIDSLAADGKVDGIKYGLGANLEELKEYYETLAEEYEAEHSGTDEHVHNDGEEFHYYAFEEGEDFCTIDISKARFYYETGKEDKGVSVIATDSETFGFVPGETMKYEVEDAIKAEGDIFEATEDELRFLAVRTEPLIVLRYEFVDYQLDFYFYDNLLVTTVLIDTNNWNLQNKRNNT